MKQCLFILVFLYSICAFAQDVIVKKDGSTILSKVLEVNTVDVKYKKYSNLNGPTYTIEKSGIMAINYESGDKDEFKDDTPVVTATDKGSKLVNLPADVNNTELISLYNHEHGITKKIDVSNKKPYYGFNVYWVSPSSILSNAELEMFFIKEEGLDPNFAKKKYYYHSLMLKNKTDKFVYVDLANSFRICSTGDVRCYYNTEQTTVTKGSGSGTNVGLGGIAGALGVGGAAGQIASGVSIGGGSSNSVSTSYMTQRIISIPPHGQRRLTEEKWVQTKEEKLFTFAEYKRIEEAELFDNIETKLKIDDLICNQIVYDENNSPFTIDYNITYSTSDSFDTYSILKANLFLHSVVGQRNLGFPHSPERYLENVDQYTLVGGFEVNDGKVGAMTR